MKSLISIILTSLLFFPLYTGCDDDKEENGEINNTGKITLQGELKDYTDCKSFKSAGILEETDDTLSCVTYSYSADSYKLVIKHINTGFNCCPGKLYAIVEQKEDTILISESEKSNDCDCECLFDMEIEVTGVVTREYVIKIVEPYLKGQEKLEFVIDLTKQTSGEYCVIRKKYPWGVYSYLVI